MRMRINNKLVCKSSLNRAMNRLGLVVALAVASGPVSADLLEEIVVTAQKREQSAQDVSIAISAFSGQQLETLGVVQTIDLATHIPNFHMKNEVGKSTPTLTIRGVGLGAFSHNSVSPVAIYMDEVFLPSSTQMGFSVFDTERVEVLKGPQGTLFGRNTTAGAVSFTSKKPHQEFESRIKVSLGNYESSTLEGVVNGALSDTVSGRLAAKIDYQGEGFYENLFTGDDIGSTDRVALKGSVLWEINDDAELLIQVHGGKEDSENHPWLGIGTADPSKPTANSAFPGGQIFIDACGNTTTQSLSYFQKNCVTKNGYRDTNPDPFVGEWSQNSVLEVDAFGAVARLDWDLGSVTMTAITGYDSLEKTTQEDFDGTPFVAGDSDYFTDLEVFSQEIRFSSNEPIADRVNWIAGAVYYHEEQFEDELYGYVDRGNHDIANVYEQETTSTGLFVHTDTRLTDQLTLIAGLRYSSDKIKFDGSSSIVNIDSDGGVQPIFPFGPPGGLPFDFVGLYPDSNLVAALNDTSKSDEMSGKIGIDYTPNEDWLLYLSYSHGYKSGGYVGFWASQDREFGPYRPEFVDAYEFGFKGTMADGNLQVNGAIFKYDYEDAQLFALTPAFAFTIINAGNVDITGAEVDMIWNPVEGLDIKGAVGYINGKLSTDGELTPRVVTDNQPANSPELSFSGLISYEMPVSDDLMLSMQADVSWQDDIFFDYTNKKALSQEAYWIGNTRIGLTSNESNWGAAFWVKNVADEEYFGSVFESGTAKVINALAGNPRTYGIELTYDW